MDSKVQASFLLLGALLLVICSAIYLAYTGVRLRKLKCAQHLIAHKDAVIFIFPSSVLIAIFAVSHLVKVSGGRFSPLWLYTVHMLVVVCFVAQYLMTMHNHGVKDPIRHVKLARQTGILFLFVAAIGIAVGSFNPVLRSVWAAL